MEKLYEDYDPSQLNTEALEEEAEVMDQVMDRREEIETILEETQETQDAEAAQAMAEVEDPRNKKGWGLKAIGKELGSAITGGLQDTGSSLVTIPERAIDMFSGEMVEEQKTDEGYKAEWDDWFVDDENPIETKTWWGGAIRGLVHFGSMVPASVLALKAAGLGGLLAGTGVVGGTLVRGAAIGATSDLMSKYSQESNALGMVRDRFGWIDTPLSTKDTDHPAMKTLKNVVEGMGIGAFFDAASIVLGKGIKRIKPGKKGKVIEVDGVEDAVQKAAKRNDSINKQNVEMAMDQAKGEDYGAYKNRTMSNKWQGATTSIDDPWDVDQSLKRINNEYGAEMGSAGSVYTPAGLKRIQVNANMATKDLKKVMSQYMSDARVQEAVAKATSENKKLFQSEGWGSSIKLAQDIFEGRNLSELTPEEFWAPLDFNSKLLDMPIISYDQVKASELVIGSLLREIRDSGITNRELYDIADLRDIDSPAAAMYDKVIAGVIHVKMAKQTQSAAFRALNNSDLTPAQLKQQVRQTVQAEAEQSIKAHQLAMQMAGDGDDDLFKAYMEAVSMSGDIHNLTDFDNYIMKKFLGGKFKDAKGNLKKESGLIVKGMGRVMTNSVLSGPKTPMRAILGTGTATFLRPLSMALGAAMRGDGATMRASLASMNAMREAIPEAWTLFRKNLDSYWSGDLSTIKTRFQEVTKGDEQWKMYTDWIEKKIDAGEATAGERFAFNVANAIRWTNDNKFLTYSTKIMGATDDAFGLILARAKAKEKAMREAMDLYNTGQITEISPEMLKKSQDDFFSQIMDADGNITDDAALYSKKEATLTSDLHGFANKLDKAFSANPWTKPFLLFARTGINGLELTAKHTPIFNMLVEESRDIFTATSKNLDNVRRYGITNATELANAKALMRGRMAMGSGLILMANMHYINGGLTGNGPSNRQQRQLWIDSGWKPRSIKIGDAWVSYDAFEPFNLILSTIGDIGDHMNQMGPEWTEKQYRKLAVVVMQGLSQKSYLASIQQFVDLFAGREGQMERIIASLANNSLPLSSLRNELGKVINPYMKELNSGIGDSIRNRNLFMEGLAGEGAVPTKYDMLTGRPIRDWDFPTRMFNAVSPFNISLDYSPGRKLLFDSGYDLRTTTFSYTFGGVNVSFKDHPHIRSMFQKAIGDQNLQYELDLLAKDPQIIASVKQMEADTWNGNRERDPMKAYYHNDIIKALFDRAKKKAWSKIKNEPEVLQLLRESKDRKIDNISSNKKTRNYKQEQIDVLLNNKNK
ncbi:MAG: hypothetical protein CMG35_08550 [Candidatus Marinimicrobia bacterium]|nr:hypothetical protein [Candidatus Neomarinimicrobiota bacterium]|tara:strand:+ start:1039 stop:4830 length:3792 start_codon:yes stop_codon:yes gene_type:complete